MVAVGRGGERGRHRRQARRVHRRRVRRHRGSVEVGDVRSGLEVGVCVGVDVGVCVGACFVGDLVGFTVGVGVPLPPPLPPPVPLPLAAAGALRLGHDHSRGEDRGRDRAEVAVHVGLHDRQHQSRSRWSGCTGTPPRCPFRRQVVLPGAEVHRGRQGRIVDVLRVAVPVAVTVDADDDHVEGMNCIGPTARSNFVSLSYCPRRCRRSSGPALPSSACPGCRASDPLIVEHAAAVPTVVGLDAADRRDELPGDPAARSACRSPPPAGTPTRAAAGCCWPSRRG